jgi:hypothetical protein
MKALLFAIIFLLTLSTNAEAQCVQLDRPGRVVIRDRIITVFRNQVIVGVRCSRYRPRVSYLGNALLSEGKSFSGLNRFGRSWRCDVEVVRLR